MSVCATGSVRKGFDIVSEARRIGSDGSMSGFGSAGARINPRRGSKF